MDDLDIVEAVLGEGSGIQANLYQMLRKKGVSIHAFHWPKDESRPKKARTVDTFRAEDMFQPSNSFRRARRVA